jgi:hypothetical protein
MIISFEYNGLTVYTNISENNGEFLPMVSVMSFTTLSTEQKQEVRQIAREKYKQLTQKILQ